MSGAGPSGPSGASGASSSRDDRPPLGAVPPGRLGYEQLPRRAGTRVGLGWSLIGVVGLLVLLLVGNSVIAVIAAAVAGGVDAVDTDPLTPTGLAVVNLGWAIAIPLALGVTVLLHRMRPGLLVSVVGRMRWRWFATCLGLAVLTLVATVAVASVVPVVGDAASASSSTAGSTPGWTGTTIAFLLVIVLLTPLQAAGEEFAFRGYLTQALGGAVGPAVAARVAAVVVPAALFALAHGAQDPPIFVDRFAFGLVAGWLVVSTGGLEAGIAMHVLNNFLAFGLSLATGTMAGALTPTGGSWWSLPSTLTQSLVYLALVTWAARSAGLTRTAPADGGPSAAVLEGPQGRV